MEETYGPFTMHIDNHGFIDGNYYPDASLAGTADDANAYLLANGFNHMPIYEAAPAGMFSAYSLDRWDIPAYVYEYDSSATSNYTEEIHKHIAFLIDYMSKIDAEPTSLEGSGVRGVTRNSVRNTIKSTLR